MVVYLHLRTHLLIADKVHDYITSQYDVQIDKSRFAFGNIKPDILRNYITKRHTMKNSLWYILREMKKYESFKKTVENNPVHIGMINHFLSDFFCSPHYYKCLNTNLKKHLEYETELHNVFEEMDKSGELDLSHISNKFYSATSFYETIRQLEKEYTNVEPSIENDIIFSLRAPLTACTYIMENCTLVNLETCPA